MMLALLLPISTVGFRDIRPPLSYAAAGRSDARYSARNLPVGNVMSYSTAMSSSLESRFTEAQQVLPAGEQSRLAEIIGAYIDHFRHAPQQEEALQNPEYRAYVEKALDEAEADRVAGRVRPMDEALDEIAREFKAEHGL